jgi:hypothetical protein
LFSALVQLYPAEGVRDRVVGPRFFISQLIGKLNLTQTRLLLEHMTSSLTCTCEKKKPHRCTCRRGKSRIAGHLLDRYFETMTGPHDPREIERWTAQLIFRGNVAGDRSSSVGALGSNTGLRRQIQKSAFTGLSGQAEIGEAFSRLWSGTTHSGISLHEGDYEALINFAFASENYPLWEFLIVRHSPYDKRTGPDALRTLMRAQSREAAPFLAIWSKVNRDHRQRVRREFIRFGKSKKHYSRAEAKRKAETLAHYENNRAQVEAGKNW